MKKYFVLSLLFALSTGVPAMAAVAFPAPTPVFQDAGAHRDCHCRHCRKKQAARKHRGHDRGRHAGWQKRDRACDHCCRHDRYDRGREASRWRDSDETRPARRSSPAGENPRPGNRQAPRPRPGAPRY